MDLAGPQAIFLHCLPSFHDLKTKIGKEMGERFHVSELEVTDEVFESGQSVAVSYTHLDVYKRQIYSCQDKL